MPHRIAIATEGPSDRAVLEVLCAKQGFPAKVASAQGKADLFRSFDKMLRVLDATFDPTHYLVVADLQPETRCQEDAERWRTEIKKRFPKARLCLCVWELEAWLLADPHGVANTLNRPGFEHPNPERIGDPRPSQVLETLFRERFGFKRGAAYHKEADGRDLAALLDLERAARASPSLAHFLRIIRTRQSRLLT